MGPDCDNIVNIIHSFTHLFIHFTHTCTHAHNLVVNVHIASSLAASTFSMCSEIVKYCSSHSCMQE